STCRPSASCFQCNMRTTRALRPHAASDEYCSIGLGCHGCGDTSQDTGEPNEDDWQRGYFSHKRWWIRFGGVACPSFERHAVVWWRASGARMHLRFAIRCLLCGLCVGVAAVGAPFIGCGSDVNVGRVGGGLANGDGGSDAVIDAVGASTDAGFDAYS